MHTPDSLIRLLRSSALRNLVLYFSISVLVNTCFFPTIERYMMHDVHFAGQADSSLLEVMLENLLGMDDAGITFADDADDVSAAVDYLFFRASIVLTIDESLDRAGLPGNYDCPDGPMLKINTPPPKV